MYNPPVDISDKRWSNLIHNALPAFMNQQDGSNNQKVLSIYTDYGNAYKNDILNYTDETLVQHASGYMLDRLCWDWGVNIVDKNDDEFKRFQIRFQMIRHRLGPGTNDVKGAISFLFNIPENIFDIVSTGLKAVKVTNLPFNFDTGDKTGLKHELIARYIRGMLPPEYELKDVEYEESVDIWFYQDIQTPKPPYFEYVTQYFSAIDTDVSQFNSYHGIRFSPQNATQYYPETKTDLRYHGAFHANRYHIINATQKLRTTLTQNIDWQHNSYHARRYSITNVTQNERKND